MEKCMKQSTPKELKNGTWHLPYVNEDEMLKYLHTTLEKDLDVWLPLKVSVARCARVSYLNHDGSEPDLEKDIKLYEMLKRMEHLSPFEHQATPMTIFNSSVPDNFFYRLDNEDESDRGITHVSSGDSGYIWWSGNFRSWIQHRQILGDIE